MSVASMTPAASRRRSLMPVQPINPTVWLIVGWILLLGANLAIEHFLKPYPHYSYDVLPTDPAFPRWKLLLPYDLSHGPIVNDEGCVHWFTTGLVVVNYLECIIGPRGAQYLLNALVITTSMWLGWLATRSLVFSFTLGLCMAFGTHFIHGYQVPSIKGLYLLLVYMECALFFAFQLLTTAARCGRWKVGFVASMALAALAHEQWLDFLLGLSLMAAVLLMFFSRTRDTIAFRKTLFLIGIAWTVAAIYLPIRVAMGSQHSAPGNESEMVFQYRHLSLAIEDVLSNLVMYVYVTVTSFLPPAMTASVSDYRLGYLTIVDEQHGYHAEYSALAAYHHLFLWRYYAGAVFVGYLYFLVRTSKRALIDLDTKALVVALLLLLIGSGAMIHWFVKFRPYLSVPMFTYKATAGVLGMSLLVSYGMLAVAARFPHPRRSWLVLGLCWATLVYSGMTRPHFQAHLSRTVGVGGIYPDPLHRWHTRPHHPTMVPGLTERP